MGIWQQILQQPRVGIGDNFFELGGHSLLATQVIAQIRRLLQVELPLRSLFLTPTIAGLSQAVELALRSGQSSQRPPLERLERPETLPLSFAQQRLWFLAQFQPGAVYNLARAVRLRGALNPTALRQSLAAVVQRHQVLRTSFPVVDGVPVQAIAPTVAWICP